MEHQELYNDIPPSLKREQSPFMAASASEPCRKCADFLLDFMFKNTFSEIRIKNAQYYDFRNPDYANIIYAPHCCWWDGLIGYFLCRNVFATDMRIMIEELQAFPFLSRLGAFSINKSSTSLILESLNYSIGLLKDSKKSLYIFPQGIIRPPDFRPIKFESGITYLAQKAEGVNLIPLAVRYGFLRDTLPEVLIDVQKPITLTKFSDRKLLNRFLQDSFEDALDSQRDNISQGNLRGYATIWKKPDSVLRRIEKKLKK